MKGSLSLAADVDSTTYNLMRVQLQCLANSAIQFGLCCGTIYMLLDEVGSQSVGGYFANTNSQHTTVLLMAAGEEPSFYLSAMPSWPNLKLAGTVLFA